MIADISSGGDGSSTGSGGYDYRSSMYVDRICRWRGQEGSSSWEMS